MSSSSASSSMNTCFGSCSHRRRPPPAELGERQLGLEHHPDRGILRCLAGLVEHGPGLQARLEHCAVGRVVGDECLQFGDRLVAPHAIAAVRLSGDWSSTWRRSLSIMPSGRSGSMTQLSDMISHSLGRDGRRWRASRRSRVRTQRLPGRSELRRCSSAPVAPASSAAGTASMCRATRDSATAASGRRALDIADRREGLHRQFRSAECSGEAADDAGPGRGGDRDDRVHVPGGAQPQVRLAPIARSGPCRTASPGAGALDPLTHLRDEVGDVVAAGDRRRAILPKTSPMAALRSATRRAGRARTAARSGSCRRTIRRSVRDCRRVTARRRPDPPTPGCRSSRPSCRTSRAPARRTHPG